MDRSAHVALARGVRLQWEPAQQARVLLYPEGMVQLNESAGEILALCDGRTLAEMIDELQRRFPDAEVGDDVLEFLADARRQGWVEWEDADHER
ncbi:pyrroloquinoline quinone biosynthesis peptide chaperone PqqD [Aquisalimonas sp.]|uniref:pyrroloquinoline quinone biosynthesis peptide chaperone PqqD n=1 Tax=Aquisalimonas sp. TaxID=1872621 RepID=UPI0025BD433F|nr:pyrroloquinoline quinone biosynthesis peptide chaperone PqqD [Aquisalimonas sp.]